VSGRWNGPTAVIVWSTTSGALWAVLVIALVAMGAS